MGILYIVSTPIGNLEDITLRALDVLKSADLILCEDTRHTGLLLKHFGVENSLFSFHDFNEARKTAEIIDKLEKGTNIALVSDAGTPLISDPGFRLVSACIENNIQVVPIPGATATLTALVASGLPTDNIFFAGYPPKQPGKRIKLFEKIKSIKEILPCTIIFYESPYKLLKTLFDLKSAFGDIEIVVARELTKIHEEYMRDKVSNIIKHFEKQKPKGEFVILI